MSRLPAIMRGYEASGVTVKEYCRSKGIHETTYYAWKKRFGTMGVEQKVHTQLICGKVGQ